MSKTNNCLHDLAKNCHSPKSPHLWSSISWVLKLLLVMQKNPSSAIAAACPILFHACHPPRGRQSMLKAGKQVQRKRDRVWSLDFPAASYTGFLSCFFLEFWLGIFILSKIYKTQKYSTPTWSICLIRWPFSIQSIGNHVGRNSLRIEIYTKLCLVLILFDNFIR